MIVSSGISFENFESAKAEILAQLEAVKNGEISDDELLWAKRSVASDLRASLDSQGELEGWWLSQAVDGDECSPTELAELVENVTKEDVMAIARSVELDMVYFLCGSDEDEEEEDEDEDTEA
jgi:predicted Zn-dependent peptidase